MHRAGSFPLSTSIGMQQSTNSSAAAAAVNFAGMEGMVPLRGKVGAGQPWLGAGQPGLLASPSHPGLRRQVAGRPKREVWGPQVVGWWWCRPGPVRRALGEGEGPGLMRLTGPMPVPRCAGLPAARSVAGWA